MSGIRRDIIRLCDDCDEISKSRLMMMMSFIDIRSEDNYVALICWLDVDAPSGRFAELPSKRSKHSWIAI